MIEVHRHHRSTKWELLKIDASERFLNFETFNGLIYIAWGYGFIFYGFPRFTDYETLIEILKRPQFGYNYALMSIGAVLIFWGLRKVLVNRIKQHEKSQRMVARRKEMACFLTSKQS